MRINLENYTLALMLKARIDNNRIEAGCDEVGRGCLAGARLELTEIIKSNSIAWAISFVDPVIIDRINILNASFLAMERAVKQLTVKPDHLLIDGDRFKSNLDVQFTCIIKGDSKNGSIAAASIVAKTYRDEYMKRIHEEYPEYVWNNNVGYPTKAHREAIRNFGPTPYHRKSFRLLP